MDELKISSKFTTSMISKILSKVLSKALGCKIDICVSNVQASVPDGDKVKIYAEVGAEMQKSELLRLVTKNGLI